MPRIATRVPTSDRTIHINYGADINRNRLVPRTLNVPYMGPRPIIYQNEAPGKDEESDSDSDEEDIESYLDAYVDYYSSSNEFK